MDASSVSEASVSSKDDPVDNNLNEDWHEDDEDVASIASTLKDYEEKKPPAKGLLAPSKKKSKSNSKLQVPDLNKSHHQE